MGAGRYWVGNDSDRQIYVGLVGKYRQAVQDTSTLQQRFTEVSGNGMTQQGAAATDYTKLLTGPKLAKFNQWKQMYPKATQAQIDEAAKWLMNN